MNFGGDHNFGGQNTSPNGDDLSSQLGQRLQASELRTAQTLGNMPYPANPQQSSLENTLKSIVSHIEVSDQRTAQAFQGIQQQMSQIASHPTMANAAYGAQNSSAVNDLEGRLNSLVGQLETSIAQNAHANSPANAQNYGRLEEQVSQLAQNYAQAPNGQNPYDQESADLKALDGHLQNLGQAQDNFDGRLNDLASRINQNVAGEADPNISALQNQVNDLHSQINTGAAHDPAAQTQIENHLAHISQRLAETEERIHSVANLEASVQDLNQKIGDSNNTTDLSENKNALKALNQALGALRLQTKTSEDKTNETLEAVHDTLEKVITRIASLEQSPPEVVYRGTPQPDPVLSALPPEYQQPNMAPPPTAQPDASAPDMGATADIYAAPQREERVGAVSNNFIEAARRAAQENVSGKPSSDEKVEKKKGQKETKGKSKKRPLLLAAAAVLIVIGGMQSYKLHKAGKLKIPVVSKLLNKYTTSETVNNQAAPALDDPSSQPITTITKSPDKPLPGTPSEIDAAAPSSPTQTIVKTTPAPVNTPVSEPVTPALQSKATQPETGSPFTAPQKSAAAPTTPVTSTSAPRKTSTLAKQTVAPKPQKAASVQTTKPKTVSPLPPLGSGYKELPQNIGPESMRRAAASGNPEAQFAIASNYLNGTGVKKDTGKAIIWYQRAAAKGLAPAQYRLGTFYEKGRGVKQDKLTARIWYERAAEQGNRKAMHNLAVIYADANNGKPDFTKAALWFRKASERNLTDSQFNLGILSERGLGVPKDPVEAYKWFAIAGAKGDKDSETRKNAMAKTMEPRALVLAKLAVDNWTPRPLKQSANVVSLKNKSWLAANTQSSPKYLQRQLVSEAQSRLNTLGYKAGPPDGIMGRRTRDAIKQYQQKMGLKVTGSASADLIKHLRSKTG